MNNSGAVRKSRGVSKESSRVSEETATFSEKAVDFLRNRRARLGRKAQRMPTFVDFAGVPYGIGRFDRERLRAQQAVGAIVDQDFARTRRAFERIIAQNGHPQLGGGGGKGLLRQKSLVATAQLGLIGRQLAGVGKKQGHERSRRRGGGTHCHQAQIGKRQDLRRGLPTHVLHELDFHFANG